MPGINMVLLLPFTKSPHSEVSFFQEPQIIPVGIHFQITWPASTDPGPQLYYEWKGRDAPRFRQLHILRGGHPNDERSPSGALILHGSSISAGSMQSCQLREMKPPPHSSKRVCEPRELCNRDESSISKTSHLGDVDSLRNIT